MTKRTCEYCDHWREDTQDESTGECRRESPRASLVCSLAVHWPVTKATDWCGSFAMRIVEAAYDYESRE